MNQAPIAARKGGGFAGSEASEATAGCAPGVSTTSGAIAASAYPKVNVISSAMAAFSCPTRMAPSNVANGIFIRLGLIESVSMSPGLQIRCARTPSHPVKKIV